MDKIKKSKTKSSIIKRAYKLVRIPIIIALLVTPIRFLLELIGLPENIIFIIGLLWLTLALSIYWGIKLYNEKESYLLLLCGLLIFSPISRLPVVLFWWIDTKWSIGTHYGLYFDNWLQALLNHVIYGTIIQLIPGFLIGSITLTIMKHKKSVIA